ncbi:uncharacterized protein LOC119597798 isoform X1 [Penaeus monodon]|uniref:uncharacterized protein LOC119597798 isoform X1 n=2 Tax=Penaeus monodon TaxID=6687 RepID=UPI0018A72BCE|nr:uncharacterized protein LOC119597798 isoform X1 [Penaeus monodon]
MFWLLDDSLFGPDGPHGGYIPFVETPCEDQIGETIKWITVLSIAPIACPLVPWLCCPLEIGNTSITISADQDCEEIGAIYGSTIFWTMQAVSILGLVLSFASLLTCGAGEAGFDVPQVAPVVLAMDISDAVAGQIDLNEVLEVGPLRFVTDKVVRILHEGYKKEVANELAQAEAEGGGTAGGSGGREAQGRTANDTVQEVHRRAKRQVINVPIPTLQGHVPGRDDPPSDACDRDEVLLSDGDCHELLKQGPCEEDEIVLMDRATRQGYCGARLCSPDRVFVFGDQQCHDPNEPGICPPGRRLFTTGFGTPVCGCPDGTYEEDDDLDDDVCEPVLARLSGCPAGEVFWFTSFRRPPECVPDPCKGLNLKRGPSDLPFAPSLHDGKCYQIGSRPPFCQSDELYSLSFELLRGVCSTLDDAGYQLLDADTLDFLASVYGSPLPRDAPSKDPKDSRAKPSSSSSSSRRRPSSSSSRKGVKAKITPAGTTLLVRPAIGSSVMKAAANVSFPPPFIMGQSVVANHHDDADDDALEDAHAMVALLPTHMNAFSPPLIAVNGSVSVLGFLSNLVPGAPPLHHRGRRSPQPFASPGNVFEPGLSACRAGARRDGNAKCRDTVLPSRYPPSRPRRTAPPVPARPSCPPGSFWNLDRSCSSSSQGIANAISNIGLG